MLRRGGDAVPCVLFFDPRGRPPFDRRGVRSRLSASALTVTAADAKREQELRDALLAADRFLAGVALHDRKAEEWRDKVRALVRAALAASD